MTHELVARLNAEAKVWPRSDISGLLREAAAALSAQDLSPLLKCSELDRSHMIHSFNREANSRSEPTRSAYRCLANMVAALANLPAAQVVVDDAMAKDAQNWRKLRDSHWTDGKETLIVVRVKDVRLGVKTYSGDLLTAAIEGK